MPARERVRRAGRAAPHQLPGGPPHRRGQRADAAAHARRRRAGQERRHAARPVREPVLARPPAGRPARARPSSASSPRGSLARRAHHQALHRRRVRRRRPRRRAGRPPASSARAPRSCRAAPRTSRARSPTPTPRLGMQRGGASAGINAPDDTKAEAIAAFVAELGPQAATLADRPGQGRHRGRPRARCAPTTRASRSAGAQHDPLVAAGAVAAAAHVLGGLDGARVAIEGLRRAEQGARRAAARRRARRSSACRRPRARCATPTASRPTSSPPARRSSGEGAEPAFKLLGVECDVLFTGSKAGAVDHKGAAFVTAKAVVPTVDHPGHREGARRVAPRRHRRAARLRHARRPGARRVGRAGSRRRDARRRRPPPRCRRVLDEVAGHADGPLLGVVLPGRGVSRARGRTKLPFGRPLAA